MNAKGLVYILTGGLLVFAAPRAAAGTINFGVLSEPGNTAALPAQPYTQSGFTFAGEDHNLWVWESGSINHPFGGDPATSLWEFSANVKITLSDGGAAFDLNSIDLAQLDGFLSTGPFNVVFTGTFPDTSTVTQTLTVTTIDGTPLLSTFNFSGFDGVTLVSFDQGSGSSAFQFNNVVVDSAGPTAPEPSLVPVVATLLAALFWRQRKGRFRVLAANLTAPYDATTLGDTKQSKDRFITEVYDEVKDFPPVVNGERKMPRRAGSGR